MARAVLAVTLLLGVYLLAAGIAVPLVWTAVFALRHGIAGALAGQLIGIAALTTIGLMVALFQRTRTPDLTEPGTVLTEAEQPALWSEVRDLATTVGTRPPDEIRLLPDVNAAVTEHSRMLGLVSGRRTLFLGAPLLLGLTRQQLRSVLAHELGHYSGRHTALGGVTYRGREAISRVVDRFGRDSVVGKIFYGYAQLYLWLTSAVGRQQEIEADDFSVEVAGRDAAMSALTELPVLGAAWEHYFEQFLGPVHASGKRPSRFFDGFAEILAAPKLQVALASFRNEYDEEPRSRYDSHPPLSTRIARFAAMPSDSLPLDPAPALALLDHHETALHELQEWMYGESSLEPARWSELMHGHVPADIRSRAEMLYRVASEAEHGEVNLATVVGSVRGRQLASWVRPHLEDPSPENIRETSHRLVQSAVDEALMTVAGARYSLAWDEEPRFVDADGETVDSGPVVVRAIESGDPAVLTEWLTDRGVALDYTPKFEQADPREEVRSQPARVLGVLAPIAGHRKLFCVVLTHGVLLRRANAGDQLAWWTGGKNPARLLHQRVAQRSGTELLAEQGNIWLPWDVIASVAVGRGRTRRTKLTFSCTDGNTYSVKYRMHTRDTGETPEALRFFLEDRLIG
ncbi:MAG: HtpX-like protease [Marmoricola sp.]|nr:HtpX-like protease [Marmoricola sp.]